MCFNQTFKVVHALKQKNIGSLCLVGDGLKLQLSKNVLHLFPLQETLETGPLTIGGLFSNFISALIWLKALCSIFWINGMGFHDLRPGDC
jgi:hypothetical protein